MEYNPKTGETGQPSDRPINKRIIEKGFYQYQFNGTLLDEIPLKAYKLKVGVLDYPAGTVFVHDPFDSDKGSPAYGCMKLAWVKGGCQHNRDAMHAYCGHTFVFPGQYAEDKEFFEEIPNNGEYK